MSDERSGGSRPPGHAAGGASGDAAEGRHADSAGPGPTIAPAPGLSADERAELERLRAYVRRFRLDVTTPPVQPPPAPGRLEPGVGGQEPGVGRHVRTAGHAHTAQRIIAAVLVALAGLCTVASAAGLWSTRTVLNTDRWVATMAPLPRQPQVNDAVATYLTDQVFARLDVQRRLERAWPPEADIAAGPVTEVMAGHLRRTVREFMTTERFQRLWIAAVRSAHAQLVAAIDDGGTPPGRGGAVTLDLLPITNDLLIAIEGRLPTLFDGRLGLTPVPPGPAPPGLRERLAAALGTALPADFARLTLYDRGELAQLRRAMVTLQRTVVALIVSSVLLLAAALLVSRDRRRTVLQFGVALSAGVVLTAAVLRVVWSRLLADVPAGVYRDGASAALDEVFDPLRQSGGQLLWLGLAIALGAYLTGGRQRRWTAAHLDQMRLAGIAVAAVAMLLLPSSWAAVAGVLVALVAFEALITLLSRWRLPRLPA